MSATLLISILLLQMFVTLMRERNWKKKLKTSKEETAGLKTILDLQDYEKQKADETAREWLKERADGELGHVYTDKFGQRWYAFTDITTLPAKRGMLAELMSNVLDMNITRERLLGYIKRMKDNANNGKITALFADLEHIEERLQLIAEEESLLAFAKIYFLLEGEPIKESSMKFSKLKDKTFNEDAAARSFFLISAFRLTKHYSDISDKDILEYLTKHAPKATTTI